LTSRVAAPRARTSFSRLKHVLDLPNLIDIQKASFDWFLNEGLRETIDDISPIEDYTGSLAVEFGAYKFGEPQFSIKECREKDLTYQAPLSMTVRFVNKETGEIREQTVFMGDFPMMTEWGTFIINGTERVIVTQLVRSPGAYLMEPKDATKQVFTANLMPSRGTHRPEAEAADHDPPARAAGRGPVHGVQARHELERGDPQALRQLVLHREHAREGHDHARGRGADRGLQEAAPR
jgi:DNA-directed RNA polymerase beta subunit